MLLKELRILLSLDWWKRFFASESLADGLRNTLTVILPILVMWPTLGRMPAMATGVGALLISLTDAPGNRNQKINAALRGVLIFGITAFSASYVWTNQIYTAGFFFLMPFFWSILGALGNRAWLTGSLAIILACFIIGLKPVDPFHFSLWIIIGAVWYFFVSLIQVWLQPFRSLRFAIRECLNATSDFLLLKQACYDRDVPIDEAYQLSMVGHLKVSEHQESIRELLLSDSLVIKKDSIRGRKLLTLALEVMGLYEHVSAMAIDYDVLRDNLSWQVLALIRRRIGLLAEWTGLLANGATRRKLSSKVAQRIKELELDLVGDLSWETTNTQQKSAKLLFQMEQHIQLIVSKLNDLTKALRNLSEDDEIEISGKDYLSFWDNALIFQKLKNALKIQSPIFRFSLRMGVTLSFAYLLWAFVLKGEYGYWLLLTIVVVARPRFGITWKRNAERLLGTAVGAVVGLLLLFLVPNVAVICIIAAVFLWGYYAFNRFNYTVSVFFVTVAILIAVGLLSGLTWALWIDRLWFTLWGCLFAILGLFIFPFWDKWSIFGLLKNAEKTNLAYLNTCVHYLKKEINQQQLALSRKASHTALARLSEGLQWSWLEPGRNKLDLKQVEKTQLLLYRINAVITALWIDEQIQTTFDIEYISQIENYLSEQTNLLELDENFNSYEGIGLLSDLSKALRATNGEV